MATMTRTAKAVPKPYRISVDQYLRMIVTGTFPDDTRVELLDGALVEQMTKFAPHNFTARQLGILLRSILPPPWLVSEEKSLVLGRFWRPEPDLAVIRGPNSLYRDRDPRPSDIGMLGEVPESSYAYDRGLKWRAYAAARIPIYWIVNPSDRQIEVFRDPIGRGKSAAYRESTIHGPDDEIPVVIEGQEIGRFPVREVLP